MNKLACSLLGLGLLVAANGCCCSHGRSCGYNSAPAYAAPVQAPCNSCGPGAGGFAPTNAPAFGPTGALPGHGGAPVAFVPDPVTGAPIPTTAALPTPVENTSYE